MPVVAHELSQDFPQPGNGYASTHHSNGSNFGSNATSDTISGNASRIESSDSSKSNTPIAGISNPTSEAEELSGKAVSGKAVSAGSDPSPALKNSQPVLNPNEKRKYGCDVCTKSFNRHDHLLRHKENHKEIKPFSCPICFRGFARMDILNKHVQRHESRQQKSDGGLEPSARTARTTGVYQSDNSANDRTLGSPDIPAGKISSLNLASQNIRSQYASSALYPSMGARSLPNSTESFKKRKTLSQGASSMDSQGAGYNIANNTPSNRTWLPHGSSIVNQIDMNPRPDPSFHFSNQFENVEFYGQEQQNDFSKTGNNFGQLRNSMSWNGSRSLGHSYGAPAWQTGEMQTISMQYAPRPLSNPSSSYQNGAQELYPFRRPLMSDDYRNGANVEFLVVNSETDHPSSYIDVFTRIKCLQYLHLDSTSMDQIMSLDLMCKYVKLYWAKFHSSHPLLHRPTFSPIKTSSTLLLAMIIVGSYFDPDTANQSLGKIIPKIRGVIVAEDLENERPIESLQALYLINIYQGLMSTLANHQQSAIWDNLLWTLCSKTGCWQTRHNTTDEWDSDKSVGNLNKKWAAWILKESKTRLAHLVNLRDCAWSTFVRQTPCRFFSPFQLELDLPADDCRWEATSANNWERVHTAKPAAIPDALRMLLADDDHQTMVTFNPFATCILIHGIMSIHWDLRFRPDTLKTETSRDQDWNVSLQKGFDRIHAWVEKKLSHELDYTQSEAMIQNVLDFYVLGQTSWMGDYPSIRIVAGDQPFGPPPSPKSIPEAQVVVAVWAHTESARRAAWYSASFLREIVSRDLEETSAKISGQNSRPHTVGLHRSFAIYQTAVIVWAFATGVNNLPYQYQDNPPEPRKLDLPQRKQAAVSAIQCLDELIHATNSGIVTSVNPDLRPVLLMASLLVRSNSWETWEYLSHWSRVIRGLECGPGLVNN